MGLTNAAPAGSDVTDLLLNQLTSLGARYEQKAAQSVSNVTDTKLNFPTAVHTNTDVVASGTGNTDFAIQRLGFWLVEAGIRYLGSAGSGERHIFPQFGSTFAVANRFGGATIVNVGSVPATVAMAAVARITAVPQPIIIGTWQNSGGLLSTDIGFGGANHVSFTWLGPL